MGEGAAYVGDLPPVSMPWRRQRTLVDTFRSPACCKVSFYNSNVLIDDFASMRVGVGVEKEEIAGREEGSQDRGLDIS